MNITDHQELVHVVILTLKQKKKGIWLISDTTTTNNINDIHKLIKLWNKTPIKSLQGHIGVSCYLTLEAYCSSGLN